MVRERMAWVLNRGQYQLVLTDGPKPTQSIFGYGKWPYQHKDILRQCKQYNQHRGYFRKDFYFQRFFWRYNFDSNNTEVYHIFFLRKEKDVFYFLPFQTFSSTTFHKMLYCYGYLDATTLSMMTIGITTLSLAILSIQCRVTRAHSLVFSLLC